MIELVLGLLAAAVVWFLVDVVVGSIAGELLLRPMQILLGPPAGKYVITGLWAAVAVLGWMTSQRAEPDWTYYWAWLGFLIAGVASLFALVFYKEQRRQRNGRRSGA